MRILLAPHGTRGDVQPMIALGAMLTGLTGSDAILTVAHAPQVTARALGDRIACVLSEPGFGARARELGTRIGSRNGVNAAVDYLERIEKAEG